MRNGEPERAHDGQSERRTRPTAASGHTATNAPKTTAPAPSSAAVSHSRRDIPAVMAAWCTRSRRPASFSRPKAVHSVLLCGSSPSSPSSTRSAICPIFWRPSPDRRGAPRGCYWSMTARRMRLPRSRPPSPVRMDSLAFFTRPPRPRSRDRLASAPEWRSFLWAAEHVHEPYDVIAKMDADLRLTPFVFEEIERRFEADPRLGMARLLVSVIEEGETRRERNPAYHVRGPTKFYRRSCLVDIMPVLAVPGWETIDEVKARKLGWRTASVEAPGGDPIHLRPTGSLDGQPARLPARRPRRVELRRPPLARPSRSGQSTPRPSTGPRLRALHRRLGGGGGPARPAGRAGGPRLRAPRATHADQKDVVGAAAAVRPHLLVLLENEPYPIRYEGASGGAIAAGGGLGRHGREPDRVWVRRVVDEMVDGCACCASRPRRRAEDSVATSGSTPFRCCGFIDLHCAPWQPDGSTSSCSSPRPTSRSSLRSRFGDEAPAWSSIITILRQSCSSAISDGGARCIGSCFGSSDSR